jgi:crotonobetainyl-CoA:carnitine CoA-transferase CaiB-like acyl-CoA transferase
MPDAPLGGIRVVNLGSGWAGRLASMLLADQGADVLEIVKPGSESQPADALLDRGKRLWALDLKDEAGNARCRAAAGDADLVIENMRTGAVAKLGLDHSALAGEGRIYLSLPGFAAGDPNRDLAAWEGTIDAALGVYTNISPAGPVLGGEPIYSAIPMASAYGGILGAVSAAMALYHRQRTGQGQFIEVPLADAVMSAMALLIAEVEGQPSRYNLPAIDNDVLHDVFPVLRELRAQMTPEQVAQLAAYVGSHVSPGLRNYDCADGRKIFVCASDHVYQTRTFLQVVGVLDKAISRGMVAGSPFSELAQGNNFLQAATLTPEWRKRLIGWIEEAVKTKPAAEWEALLRAANVPVTVVQTSAEWLADETLRAAGVTVDLDGARQAGRFVSIAGPGTRSPDLSPATAADAAWQSQQARVGTGTGDANAGMLHGVKVLDLSNIIAGPAAGRMLAEHGADVIRIDPPAPLAGPFSTVWFGIDVNQGKRAIVLDLKSEAGRDAMTKLVREADVVLHNFLDRSARSLGIAEDQLSAINPDIISCQISAWGGSEGGAYKDDPAFDPVLQSASGITVRYGSTDRPVLHGIASCVDYITGFSAALGIAQALVARERGRGGSHVRTSLAMGTQMVQFPFMVATDAHQPGAEPSGQGARDDGPDQGLVELADGWAFIGCRPGDGVTLMARIGVPRQMTLAHLQERLCDLPGASAIAVKTLAEIRAERTDDGEDAVSNWLQSGSLRLRRGPHPCGYRTTVPLPTWIRPEKSVISTLYPAPAPGADTIAVLREAGHSKLEVEALMKSGAAHKSWSVLEHYLPR